MCVDRWQQSLSGAVQDPYRFANTDEDDREMQRALDMIDDLNAHTPPPPALTKEFCHAEEHADFGGAVLKWGADHLQVGDARMRGVGGKLRAQCWPFRRPVGGRTSFSTFA